MKTEESSEDRPGRPSAGEAEGALDQLRQAIGDVDRRLVDLVARRVDLARSVGREKQRYGLPIRSYQTEFEVLDRFRTSARDHGLDQEFIERFARGLIGEAVREQEWHTRASAPDPKEIVIVGGSGKMGRWLGRFFVEQGHRVLGLDPVPGPPGVEHTTRWEVVETADAVLLAMPLSAGPEVLRAVLERNPRGLVADISSLKSHLIPTLRNGVASGIKIASIHPLFGPSVRTLGGRIIAVCDCGDAKAADEAESLFAETAAEVIRIGVEEHDEYMQYVLGLSHLISILFATTLARSGRGFNDLNRLASTTFKKQVRTALEVSLENSRMYYEIQRLNDHSEALFDLLRESLARIERAALSPSADSFESLIRQAREYFPEALPPDLD